MALTELEKAQNKAAQIVRDRAYRARYEQLTQALKDAENAPEVLMARQGLDQINAACNDAAKRRDQEIMGLQVRIAELEGQIAELRNSTEIHSLNAHRRSTGDAWRAVRAEKIGQAESRFPDLQGAARFSATAWNPPQDIVDAMEDARRAATADAIIPATKKRQKQ